MKRTHVCLLFLLTMAAAPAIAQVIFGAIQGTIRDESGAVIPNAKVLARNTATGVMTETQSNAAGIYLLGELRPGAYEVEVEAAGFSKSVQRNVPIRIEDRVRVDFALKVGQVSESVEVEASVPLLQTENNTIGRVVEENTIKQLPLRGRNAFELVLLTPGVVQRGADEQPRLGGGRARTGEFVLDGGSITTPRRGQVFTQPNLDAIQEFKVQTSGLSAEFGRAVGGVVNATLKSGTNRFNGNLFEFHRNNSINARNFFAASTPKLIQNQFGGMIGGPIIKDRLFFFGDFESFRQAEESLFNRTLPTPAMKSGDFSGLNQIFDPATQRTGANGRPTRDPFPNNRIPTNRFDSPSPKILAIYPDPNLPGIAQNFTRLIPRGVDNNKFDVRMDWRASDRDLVFGRYSWDHQYSDTAQPFPGAVTGGSRGNFNRYLTGAISWTRTLNPTTINDARVSYFRGINERLLSENTFGDLGIPNLNIIGLPRFTMPGFEGIGDAQAFMPVENGSQIQDILTFVRGKHIIKTGADFRSFPINDLQLQFTGEYTFSPVQTADPANAGRTGHPLASLALGHADTFNNSTLRGRFYYRSIYFGTFVQDDWKITPNLTLNIGLRYDLEQNPRETRRQGSNFDLAQGRPVTMNELNRDFIQFTDRVNFGPRVGFAWRPPGLRNTVIRSHYGISYIPLTGRATSAFARFPADQRLGLQSDGLNPAAILSRTPPIIPSVDGKGFAIDTKIERPKTGDFQQWNFDIQHEWAGMLLQASYAGSVAHHLLMNQDHNVIRIEDVQRAGTGTQAMRPYPDYGFILCHCELQNSSYNALQLGMEKRYSRGLFFSVSYTFSKFLDYNEDNFSSMMPMDPYNLRLERGLSQSHFPHRFVTAAVWDVPFGKGRQWLQSGPAAWVAGGWQLSNILSLESGEQVWITQAANTARTFSRQFRPNLIANPILEESDRVIGRWFNTAAFQAPAPLNLGTSAKFPNVQGPGLANLDVSLIRFFPIPLRETMKFELRGDFFNVLNRTNFSAPSGVFGTPNFARVTGARLPRTIQLGLKFWF
ncbi:MAG: carboxypeptidase regulatory-like domain-containing protein [Bryobacteraceae bacterium]|nr:carboxypeptidase regulatory-like domain-containing protein [Bryobacteraceae bacterium]